MFIASKCRLHVSFLDFANFVAFFPQLVAGPIERSGKLLPQLTKLSRPTREDVLRGIDLLLWGFCLKVFVADNLAVYVDFVYTDPTQFANRCLFATYAFAFQILEILQVIRLLLRGWLKPWGLESSRTLLLLISQRIRKNFGGGGISLSQAGFVIISIFH